MNVVVKRLVLPRMLARGKGAVVNVSSASALLPTPLTTVYAATKAYVAKFTDGLSLHLAA